MYCPRCRGCVVHDILYIGEGRYNHLPVLRCLNCGHIEDPVMRERKRAQQLDKELSQ